MYKITNKISAVCALACLFLLPSCGGGGGGESTPPANQNEDSNKSTLFLMRSEYEQATISINSPNLRGTFTCVKGGRITKSSSRIDMVQLNGGQLTNAILDYDCKWSQEDWNNNSIKLNLYIQLASPYKELTVYNLTLECPNGNTSSATVSGNVSAGANMKLTCADGSAIFNGATSTTGTLQSGTFTINY